MYPDPNDKTLVANCLDAWDFVEYDPDYAFWKIDGSPRFYWIDYGIANRN